MGFQYTKEMMIWIPRMFLLVFAVLVVYGLLGFYIHRDIDVKETEGSSVVEKAFSCIEKQGFKLEKEALEKCLRQDKYGIRFSIDNEKVIIKETLYHQTAPFHRFEKYYRHSPFVRQVNLNGEEKLLKIEVVFQVE